MRTSKIILKVPQVPKITIEVKEVGGPTIVKFTKGSTAIGLLNEMQEIKNTADNKYDYLWRLRGFLSKKIGDQLDNPDKDYTFVIEFVKKRISETQTALGVGSSGACC